MNAWKRPGCGCLTLWMAILWSAMPPPVRAEGGAPLPNPAEPVDYVRWINEKYAPGEACAGFEKVAASLQPFRGTWGDTTSQPWSGNAPIELWLGRNRAELERYGKTALRRDCALRLVSNPSDDPLLRRSLWNIKVPPAWVHREACRGLMADGWRAWASGDRSLLPKNAKAVLGAGRHLMSSPLVLHRLVGISASAMVYQAVPKVLADAERPAEAADVWLEALGPAERTLPPLSIQVEFERLAIWDACQRWFVGRSTDGTWTLRDSFGRFFTSALGQAFTSADATALRRSGFDRTMRDANGYFDEFLRWVDKPFHLTAGPADREREQYEAFDRIRVLTQNPLLKKTLPPLARVRELDETLTASRRAAYLLLHLFLHRRDHGAFPETLSALSAPGMAELSIDPYSGRPFVYRTTNGGADFTLYSVSYNRTDDGGRHVQWSDDGDFVFRPVRR